MNELFFANLSRWNPSERINGVLYPQSICWLWSKEELAAIGLYKGAVPEEIPEGKQIGRDVEWHGDVLRYVLVDSPPVPDEPPLEATRAQAETALYYFRLPDGTDPRYYEQYEEALQNSPYPPLRMWARGSLKWVENHDYVRALGMELVPPIDEETNRQLFLAAQTYEQ